MVPVISAHFTAMPAPLPLVPIFAVIVDGPVSLIAALVRITKLPADARCTQADADPVQTPPAAFALGDGDPPPPPPPPPLPHPATKAASSIAIHHISGLT